MSVWGKPLIINSEYGANGFDPDTYTIAQGSIATSTGKNTTTNQAYRLRTSGYFPAAGEYVVDSNFMYVRIYYYETQTTSGYISASSWRRTPAIITAPVNAAYARIVMSNSTNGSGTDVKISPSDFEYLTVRQTQNSMIYMS